MFTGDTLLIRGTGRTDFQNGDARMQYASIFNRLLKLPDETLVYPAHDYKGETVSTIGEERAFIPRLRVRSVDEYVQVMSNLNLPDPKMMDVAVPANPKVGFGARRGRQARLGASCKWLAAMLGRDDIAIVDLREMSERERDGEIPGALHVPYTTLVDNLKPGGALHKLGSAKQVVFFYAFGERSAMAVRAARETGLTAIRHLHGGFNAWRQNRIRRYAADVRQA